MENPEDCLVHLKTASSTKLRCLFETLSPILNEGSLVFSTAGLTVRGINVVLLVDVQIDAEGVDEYLCQGGPRRVCVAFSTLHSCLCSATADETVCIQVTQTGLDAPCPYISVFLVGENGQYVFSFQISLLAIDDNTFEVPDSSFQTVVCVPSQNFQRVLRCAERRGNAMQVFTKHIDGVNYIVFATDGDEATLVFSLRFEGDQKEECLKLDRYSLKYLLLVAKATSLSSYVTVFLKKDFVLGIKYKVGTIGTATFCLAPLVDKATSFPEIRPIALCPGVDLVEGFTPDTAPVEKEASAPAEENVTVKRTKRRRQQGPVAAFSSSNLPKAGAGSDVSSLLAANEGS